MTTHSLLLLPGDGIGPEVMAEVERIVAFFNKKGRARFETETALVGGASIDRHGTPLTDEALAKASKAEAIVFGAVGGPKWDKVPYAIRPEAGLLRLRKELDLFANLRPAICYPALAEASSLRREHVEGLDILILRELTGGTYFGEPKEIVTLESGEKRAVDTTVYTTHEIERIARVAFDLARRRRNKVHSAEKRNVMKTGVLWNEVVSAVHAKEAKDVELSHILADACAMQLVRNPKQFDVIVTDNLFGDMLSDEAAMLTGSIGMLPSASLGAPDAKTGQRKALYEPVHGSAPDIAGKGLANPIAAIASYGMALRYSYGLAKEADLIDKAIAGTLERGFRTGDIMQPNMRKVGTSEMGKAILEEMERAAGGGPPESHRGQACRRCQPARRLHHLSGRRAEGDAARGRGKPGPHRHCKALSDRGHLRLGMSLHAAATPHIARATLPLLIAVQCFDCMLNHALD
jgi:3-isopropylmalate dehydrogenase